MTAQELGAATASEMVREASAEMQCSQSAAARHLLEKGFGTWVWPDGLTSDQVTWCQISAAQMLWAMLEAV